MTAGAAPSWADTGDQAAISDVQTTDGETVDSAAPEDDAPRLAEAPEELGPPVDAPVTSLLFGPNHTGSITDFNDIVGPRGLVLIFVRSLDWCPICRIEAVQTFERRAEFAVRQVGLAFVTNDAPEDAADFVTTELEGARVIAAKDTALIERMELIDPTFPVDNRYYGAPFPTGLVIDAEGVVRAKLFFEVPPGDVYGSGQALVASGYDWNAQIDELLSLVDAAFWPQLDAE